MADAEPTESPLKAAAGTASPEAADAFGILADETRLAILLALWEEYDPHADDNVPFSKLFQRTGYEDRGNFSYHLEKLEGKFVEQHADRGGYELSTPGLKIVRAVIAGTGVGNATLEASEIDQACPLCDASTVVSYRDGLVLWSCTECDGVAPDEIETDGALGLVQFEPAGLANWTAEELRAASMLEVRQRARSLFNGLCPTCSSPADGWLQCCPDHDQNGVCDHCGMQYRVLARFQCRICEEYGVTSPKRLALFHPTVVAFYDDHGISTRLQAEDFDSAKRVHDLVDDHELNVVSEDPPRVTVRASLNGDDVQLTFDETVTVIDADR
jgi:DNA-binding transcriptional ArsR family regulator/Zn-finger nucleic acid-binding protein